MTEAYDGRQVVGMDLHRRRSVLVRMTEDGRRLGSARIVNSPAALRREIARAGRHPRVVLEATYGWYWAADVLEEAGAEVHLAHPLGVKAFACRRVKDDFRDAADLADLLRMGRLPEAWIAPAGVRELRPWWCRSLLRRRGAAWLGRGIWRGRGLRLRRAIRAHRGRRRLGRRQRRRNRRQRGLRLSRPRGCCRRGCGRRRRRRDCRWWHRRRSRRIVGGRWAARWHRRSGRRDRDRGVGRRRHCRACARADRWE